MGWAAKCWLDWWVGAEVVDIGRGATDRHWGALPDSGGTRTTSRPAKSINWGTDVRKGQGGRRGFSPWDGTSPLGQHADTGKGWM